MNQPHTFKIRVYYEDTDAGGVVYHSNYLNFTERARSEMLRDIGADQTALRLQDSLIFVVGKIECRFIKPAILDDELLIQTVTTSAGKVSMTFSQKVFRGEELLFTADVKAGSVDAHTFKPKPMPKALQEKLKS